MRWWPLHRRLPGMISPLIVWALHFVAVYALAGLRCGAPPAREPQISARVLDLGLAAVTVFALAAIVLLGLAGWRGWRLHGIDAAGLPKAARERQRFMGLVMLALAVLAAIAVALTALPILLLEPCR